MSPKKNFTKRTRPSFTEKALGLHASGHARIEDYFSNQAARTGWGTPSLGEGAEYELIRFSYSYWTLITLYRNHWISRRIVDTPAIDMVRAWPKLTSGIDPKDLGKLDRAVRRTGTKAAFQTGLIWSRLFGGAGCLMVIDGQEKELDQPLDLDSIQLGSYKGLCPFDRWAGIMPDGEICVDPSRPLDFNKPEFYRVTPVGGESFHVHASRILRFLGPEVPTPEREAQTWWGISVLEPIFEDIKKYDNMSWNILNLTFRANIMGMKFPDLASLLSGLGSSQKASQGFEQRMAAVNHLISNQSLVPLPQDGSIESTQYTFGGLDSIFQLFQLAISGGSQIPVTRLWGRTYSGLGVSREQDEMLYEEKIASDQSTGMIPQCEKLYPVLCMSELGQVPEDMDLVCPSIRVLDEKEKAELAKTVTDTVTVAIQTGLISPQIAAQELKQSSDATGIFTNITDEFISTLSDKATSESELGEGLFPGGEEGAADPGGNAPSDEDGEPNLSPSSSPQKVLKEVGKEKKAAAKQTEGASSETEDRESQARRNWLVAANDSDGTGPEREIHGLTCVIETPKGFSRHGVDDKGKPWKTVMPAHYGYLKGHAGADGDSLDCYVGPDPTSRWAYVMDQSVLGNRNKYDEAKCMLGFTTQADALAAYDKGHHRAKDILLDFTPMRINDFKSWLADRDPRKPCSAEVRAR